MPIINLSRNKKVVQCFECNCKSKKYADDAGDAAENARTEGFITIDAPVKLVNKLQAENDNMRYDGLKEWVCKSCINQK